MARWKDGIPDHREASQSFHMHGVEVEDEGPLCHSKSKLSKN